MVIARRTQQMFLDDLLTSYQQIQTSFAKQLYKLYKGFEFRSLWNVDDQLSKHQRRAVEAARGTGKLLGVAELSNALKEINQIQNKARKCVYQVSLCCERGQVVLRQHQKQSGKV